MKRHHETHIAAVLLWRRQLLGRQQAGCLQQTLSPSCQDDRQGELSSQSLYASHAVVETATVFVDHEDPVAADARTQKESGRTTCA